MIAFVTITLVKFSLNRRAWVAYCNQSKHKSRHSCNILLIIHQTDKTLHSNQTLRSLQSNITLPAKLKIAKLTLTEQIYCYLSQHPTIIPSFFTKAAFLLFRLSYDHNKKHPTTTIASLKRANFRYLAS